MKLSIKNLGPIKNADIEIGNLTIFVGPNGTGKSYLAKTVYGIYNFEQRIPFLLDEKEQADYELVLFGRSPDSQKAFVDAIQKLDFRNTKKSLEIILANYSKFFAKHIHTFFNDKKSHFENVEILVKVKSQLNMQNFKELIKTTVNDVQKEMLTIELGNNESSNDKASRLKVNIASFVSALINAHLCEERYARSIYLPASRSNFLLTYKTLLRARGQNSGLLNTGRSEDLFDQPTENFLKTLFDIKNDANGLMRKQINEMEKALFQDGSLKVDMDEAKLAKFDYVLSKNQEAIKWHNASSMVGELSPLFVILRNVYWKNSILVIDEPESHLHPTAQKMLIDYIALAVNKDLKILLITHSPYILSCVNNLIKWGGIVKSYPYDKEVLKLSKLQNIDTGLDFNVCKAYKFSDGKVKSLLNKKTNLFDESEFTTPFDNINFLYESIRNIEWDKKEEEKSEN